MNEAQWRVAWHLRLSGLVTIYVSSLLNLNEFKCSLLTATARESWGWFSRTRGPQIWLCPAVSEGKQSPLTFQSSNSDKSDVLRLLSHDRSDVNFSYRECQRVFFAAPVFICHEVISVTSLCVSTLTPTYFHILASNFPHFFQKSTKEFLR